MEQLAAISYIMINYQQSVADYFVQVVDKSGKVLYSDPIRYGIENKPVVMSVIAAGQHYYVPPFLDMDLRDIALSIDSPEEKKEEVKELLTASAQQQPKEWTENAINFLKKKDPEYYNWVVENVLLKNS